MNIENYELVKLESREQENQLVNCTAFYDDTVVCSVSKLKEAFPDVEPQSSGDGKVKYEFTFGVKNVTTDKIEFGVTLYDWKEDWYDGSLTEDDDIYFHVGGRCKEYTEIGKALIEEAVYSHFSNL